MKRLMYLVALCAAAVLALAPAAAQAQTGGGLDCGHFANQETAQEILDANPNDPYEFDADGDGVACEDSGTGTAEDGTLAPFAQYAQYSGAAAPAQLAETGGPSLLWTAFAASLLLGVSAAMAVFAAARRSPHVAALAGAHRAFAEVGANGKRLAVIALAAALATLLAVVLGSGVLGTAEPAKAQGGAGSLYLTTSVHPRPTNAVPVGTTMDFLVTEQNVTAGGRSARNVTVDVQLPSGVTYVSAHSSQGSCFPMADEPTINCSLGTIRPGGVVHINVVAVATQRGYHIYGVSDSPGNATEAGFTIVRALS